jgi:hypothetical protein
VRRGAQGLTGPQGPAGADGSVIGCPSGADKIEYGSASSASALCYATVRDTLPWADAGVACMFDTGMPLCSYNDTLILVRAGFEFEFAWTSDSYPGDAAMAVEHIGGRLLTQEAQAKEARIGALCCVHLAPIVR